jgi:hypothetical protein
MARLALGAAEQARAIFERLISYGQEHLNDDVKMDYFAVSLPDFVVFEIDLNQRNRIHCHYMMALGELGLGDDQSAVREFDRVLAEQPDHLGSTIHRAWIDERSKYPSLKLTTKKTE